MPRYLDGPEVRFTINDGIFLDTEFFNGESYEALEPHRMFPVSGKDRYIALLDAEGKDVAIIALGGFYQLGEQVYIKLKENGINATLINPRYITGIDEEMLEGLKKNHKLVITLEDGILEGGFGEKIASYYGTSDMFVKNYGIKKSFPDRFIASELLKENGISVDEITKDIFGLIKL